MKKIILQLFLLSLFGLTLSIQADAQSDQQTVTIGQLRITILSPTLFEIQVRDGASFEAVSGLNLNPVPVEVKRSTERGQTMLSTPQVTLSFAKLANTLADLQLAWKSGAQEIQISDILEPDAQNLGGIVKSLDKFEGRMNHRTYDMKSKGMPQKAPAGLLSRRGWTLLKYKDGDLYHGNDTVSSHTFFLFAYGQDYYRALADLMQLTGDAPLLPQWALGAWFSRYQPISPAQYHDYLQQFRQLKMPLDVFICDMNWHDDDWYGLRYNQSLFPDMKGFLSWAHKEGMHVGFNHHPGGIAVDDPRSEKFARENNLLDTLTATKQKKGKVMAFNYDDPKLFRSYYQDFLAPLIYDGLDFHWVDGYPKMATQERYFKMTEELTGKRAFILTRQTEGGFFGHKYPIAFSGDTWIDWSSLKFTLETTIDGSNNGVYWSHDVGGFMKGDPDGELFARWIQAGSLAPIMRLHANGGPTWNPDNSLSRLPWTWGPEVLNLAQASFQLRYKLLPYLYTLTRMTHDSGAPFCKAMFFNYPTNEKAYQYKYSQYLLGNDLLAAPIDQASGKGEQAVALKTLWIPPGTWFDYHTGEKYVGPVEIDVKKPLDEIPLYVKAGAVLTCAPYREHANLPLDTLVLEVFQPDTAYAGSDRLYEDDGISLAYKEHDFRWTSIDFSYNKPAGGVLNVNPSIGAYPGAIQRRAYRIRIRHTGKPSRVTCNDLELKSWSYNDGDRSLILDVPATAVTKLLSIAYH